VSDADKSLGVDAHREGFLRFRVRIVGFHVVEERITSEGARDALRADFSAPRPPSMIALEISPSYCRRDNSNPILELSNALRQCPPRFACLQYQQRQIAVIPITNYKNIFLTFRRCLLACARHACRTSTLSVPIQLSRSSSNEARGSGTSWIEHWPQSWKDERQGKYTSAECM